MTTEKKSETEKGKLKKKKRANNVYKNKKLLGM